MIDRLAELSAIIQKDSIATQHPVQQCDVKDEDEEKMRIHMRTQKQKKQKK